MMRPFWKGVRRYRMLAAAAVVIAGGAALTATARAQTDGSGPPGRALDEDVMRLAVVVMANQTPITQADAQAVLPALEKIRTQLDAQRQAGTGPDEAAMTDLDAQLRGALPAQLLAAVNAVRLLAFAAPPGPPDRAGAPGPPPGGDGAQLGPPPGGHGGPHGGPGRGGPMGLRMLGPLTDFFKTTAAG